MELLPGRRARPLPRPPPGVGRGRRGGERRPERAGPEREALGRLIDAYLRTAPVAPPTEVQRLTIQAQINRSTPLTEARVARGLRVDDVVGELECALSVPERLRAKLRSPYQRLEGAQLEVPRVDGRVWEALGTVFGGLDVRRLATTTPPPAPSAVYARMAEAAPGPTRPGALAKAEPPAEPDEVDRLLFGAP